MIVMKFGGSSIESPEAIRRVCNIIRNHAQEHPIVIVSAIGKTTDQLLTLAEQASKGHGYHARKTLSGIQDNHFRIADDLVCGVKLDLLERSLQGSFRELHGLIHDLSEDGKQLTPALSDYFASFGERLSSEIVAAALLQLRVPAVRLDAREFIVTDDRHGSATPLYWETYARLRRAIPQIGEESVAVMGGFIGATESGVTTTLGRGGSDLTASLVGAGISADEIQIWTDVDGMLTCDPRVLGSVYRLRSLSFEEAAAMAGAGAKVLHPDSIQPALRQRIPVSIRNSRKPQQEGTCISSAAKCPSSGVKVIALKENLIILRITSKQYPTGPGLLATFRDLCHRRGIEPALLCGSGDSFYLGLTNATALDALKLELDGCVEVQLRSKAALITLVGAGLPAGRNEITVRIGTALRNVDVQYVHDADQSLSIAIIVPQAQSKSCCERLHREFFSTVDAELFGTVSLNAPEPQEIVDPVVAAARNKIALLGRFAFRLQ
jgi:aspartate kinase